MTDLMITVVGGRTDGDGPFWPRIEGAISALLGAEVGDGRGLTRIARPDGSANYRSRGRYELTYETSAREYAITLNLG